MTDELVLEMRGIRKEFPGIIANDNVSFQLRRGEVHALLGENGAGKTTLMRVAFGMLQPDAGIVRVQGVERRLSSPREPVAVKPCSRASRCIPFPPPNSSPISAQSRCIRWIQCLGTRPWL